MTVTVAVDAMGGDFGPPVTVPASLSFLARQPDAHVILVGNAAALRAELAAARGAQERLTLREASEVVEMHESLDGRG